MKRLLLAAVLGAAALGVTTPASAAIGGGCDGKVDVACNETPCQPDYPCTINICLVWVGKCVV
ncbi:MAG TPA: hypothetical protein VNQ77_14090 [Frankiaceae bacterium]|nr:hypothetical protein [Frankiaceae bacterium]